MAIPFKIQFAFLAILVFSIVKSSTVIPANLLEDDSEYYSAEAFILNGTSAETGEFPHQVSLYSTTDKESFCGGTIITPKLIVTAAHCLVHMLPSDFIVVASLTDLSLLGKGNEETRNASYVLIHEDYDNRSKVNDIAIIELNSTLDYNNHVGNISLPKKNEEFEGDVTVIGWGLTEYGFQSSKLKKAKLGFVELERCKKLYRNSSLPVTEKNICAGLWGAGMCHGDSGGPAICRRTEDPSNGNTARVLCGIVSFGSLKCGRSPGVFTQVASYIDWIEHADINIEAHKAADKLVKNGVNFWNETLETPLHRAAVLVDKDLAVKVIKILINFGTVVSAEDSGGYTFLHRLMDSGDHKISPPQLNELGDYLVFKTLINLLNVQDPTYGRTPFMLAAANGELDQKFLSLLQNKDVDFTMVDKNGKSALFYAPDGSNNQKLLAGIFNLKTVNLEEATTAMDEKSAQLLVKLGADLNSKNENLQVPLHYAAASNDKNFAVKLIKFLIDNGANALVTDGEGQTFLHKLLSNGTTLTASGFVEIAQYLSSKRLSSLFNIPDWNDGATPLMLARQNVELDTATKLFLRRVDVNFTPLDGMELPIKIVANTSLIHENLEDAIADMDEEYVKELVRLGADVNKTIDKTKTPLHLAAASRDKAFAINIIKFLIVSGANPYARDTYYRTFLHQLFDWDSQISPTQFYDIANFLISNNISKIFNYGDRLSVTPFHLSVQNVEIDTATLSLLKDNGVDLNAVNNIRASVLFCATWANRSPKLVTDLVALGANPNHLTSNKISLLHVAAANGNVDLLKQFLNIGLDINARDDQGRTPLHEAIEFSENPTDVVKFLIKNGANSYIGDVNDESPRDLYTGSADIFYSVEGNKTKELLLKSVRIADIKHKRIADAIEEMDEDSVKALVMSGANVNQRNNKKETPLHLAAVSKNTTFAINIIKFLINFGANVYAKDWQSLTFLHKLVGDGTTIQKNQFHDIVTFLISKSLSRGLFNSPGPMLHRASPFQLALSNIEIENETLSLLKHNDMNININSVDSGGQSALYYAVSRNKTLNLIVNLVSMGADPLHVTDSRVSMLHAAAANGNVDLIKYFLDKKLDVNAWDYYSRTPLHYAVQSKANVFNTVRFLLKNRASVGITDKNGKSPRDYFNARRGWLPHKSKVSTCLSLLLC